MRRTAGIGAAAVLAALLCPAAARAAPAAAELASICASCHAAEGPAGGIPRLAGLREADIEDAMRAYRSGERRSQVMRAVAGALSAEETAEVARYLADRRQAAQ